MSDPAGFWLRVLACKHRWSGGYYEHYPCTCGNAGEKHCLKCGVYVTDDPCGEQSGMSGWGKKRRSAQDRRRVNMTK